MNYRSFDDLSETIKANLSKIHRGDFDLIVGVPRSGMIPAYMIGLYLNINVTDVGSYIDNSPLRKGTCRVSKKNLQNPHDAQRVLLVDDSVRSGRSMFETIKMVPEHLTRNLTTLAVYSDRLRRTDVDIILECVHVPRVFEWNIFHHDLLAKACVDIDGVLCVDPNRNENDDGARYIEFLTNASPHVLPSYKIHSLVTSRLEKYRPQTEVWLKKHGIEYQNLIMLDLPTKEERQKRRAHAEHKANYYNSMSELSLFIESDMNQAEQIMRLSSKPVYCVDKNIMLRPGSFVFAVNNPRQYSGRAKARLSRRLPKSIKHILRLGYRIFNSRS
jgi:uncharacterized HAD superfamily protein/hypoxanthine-guanine phosphoribosyltransferase